MKAAEFHTVDSLGAEIKSGILLAINVSAPECQGVGHENCARFLGSGCEHVVMGVVVKPTPSTKNSDSEKMSLFLNGDIFRDGGIMGSLGK